MEKILGTLLTAKNLMPRSIAHTANADMLLTLLFWKLMSASQQARAGHLQQAYHQADVRIKAIMAGNCLRTDAATGFDACHWACPTCWTPIGLFGMVKLSRVWLRLMMHVVMTGRHAPFELLDFADLLTEMRAVKHPYAKQGLLPQVGVEF